MSHVTDAPTDDTDVTQAQRLVLQMQDHKLTRFSYEVEDGEHLNLAHIALSGAMLVVAYEWGYDFCGSFHRQVPKTHGTRKEDEGYEPIDGQTLYL